MKLIIIPALTIDLDFCGADDHLLIGIGGERWGVYEETEGLYLKLELWIEEETLRRVIENIRTFEDATYCSFRASDELGQRILTKLAEVPGASEELANRLIAALRRFREDPYVTEQAEMWRQHRSS